MSQRRGLAGHLQKRMNRVKGVSALLSLCLLLLCVSTVAGKTADKEIPKLDPYIFKGSYALEIDNKVVRSSNIEKSLIPASTIKVLTSLMALEILGPEFRFDTTLYFTSNKQLYIKGTGDPFLTSEAVDEIARTIKRKGISTIESLILDDSSFAGSMAPPGASTSNNPYDAHIGGLAVNFNALPFIKRNKRVVSGEPQTPHLPMMTSIARHFRGGKYRVNVNVFPKEMGFSNTLRYSGELFSAIFKNHGIHIKNGFRPGKWTSPEQPLLTYTADKNVADLVRNCLYYSNNYIANQLFLTSGAVFYGYPATWEKSQRMAEEFMRDKLHLTPGAIVMVDGSGLSLENRVTAQSMLTVLHRFEPYRYLLRKKQKSYLKSGTLTGVYSYVGYFEDGGRLAPFVLLLNQRHNHRKRVLQLLQKEFYSIIFNRPG